MGDNGTLNLQGTLTVNGDLNVGDVSARRASTVNISAGATVNAMTFYIGKFGSSNGTVVQSGGSVNTLLGGGTGGSAVARRLRPAAVGTYKLQGGSINVADDFRSALMAKERSRKPAEPPSSAAIWRSAATSGARGFTI